MRGFDLRGVAEQRNAPVISARRYRNRDRRGPVTLKQYHSHRDSFPIAISSIGTPYSDPRETGRAERRWGCEALAGSHGTIPPNYTTFTQANTKHKKKVQRQSKIV